MIKKYSKKEQMKMIQELIDRERLDLLPDTAAVFLWEVSKKSLIRKI